MNRNTTWTRGEFEAAVQGSHSIAQTARKLGIQSRGTVKKYAAIFGIDTAHFFAERTIADRFWSHVERTSDCWLWTLTLNTDGYGRFRAGSRKVMAHRFAYEEARGVVPGGLELDHLCAVRHCVNPDHLEPVTHDENVRRAVERGC